MIDRLNRWLYRSQQAGASVIDFLKGGTTKRRLVVLELEARHAKDACKKLISENRDFADRIERLEAFITGR